MAFDKLNFTKDWNSQSDFPTYEASEDQVRKDMQCLHNETRDYLNDKLLPSMEEELSKAKKYVDDTAKEFTLGVVPDGSITGEKLSPDLSGSLYRKAEVLSEETREAYALEAGANPDAAFADILNRLRGLKLSPVNPVEVGPYDGGDDYFVCDGNGEAYQIYAALCDDSVTTGGVNSCPAEEYHAGRYSYGWYNRLYAYKLDHVTKQAELLCDLSAYEGSTADKDTRDGIFAIDEQHIYFAQHTVTYGGTIYKFDYTGALVASAEADATQDWLVHINEGYGSDDYKNVTLFDVGYNCIRWQTKNFIIIRHRSTLQNAGSNEYEFYYHAVSKAALKLVPGTASSSSVCKMLWRASGSFFLPFYDSDKCLVGLRGKPDPYSCYLRTITETGYESKMETAMDDDENEYTYEASFNPFVVTDKTGLPWVNWTESVPVYCQSYTVLVDHETGVRYLRLAMKSNYDDFENSGPWYTVVTDEDCNPETGTIILAGGFKTSISFGNKYYDPVLKDWKSGGKEYSVYPSYVAPESPGAMPERFEMVPFFRTDGWYYFLRTADNQVFKCKDETQYVVDRVDLSQWKP